MRIALELHVNSQMSEQERKSHKLAKEQISRSRFESAFESLMGPMQEIIHRMFAPSVCPACEEKMRQSENAGEPGAS